MLTKFYGQNYGLKLLILLYVDCCMNRVSSGRKELLDIPILEGGIWRGGMGWSNLLVLPIADAISFRVIRLLLLMGRGCIELRCGLVRSVL